MLWSEEVLKENSHEMKRLWLAGTIAAGIMANSSSRFVCVDAVWLADQILEELAKEKAK